jgi:lipoprotein NlpD
VRDRTVHGWLIAACVLALAAGCASKRPAPVEERGPAAAAKPAPKAAPREPDTRPEAYTVRRGDTLYSIALEHGLDYRELADWNGIANPNVIRVGQELRLRAPAQAVVAKPIQAAPPVEGRSIGSAPAAPRAVPADGVVREPRAARVPYTDQALAQLSAPAAAEAKPEPRGEPPAAKPEPRPEPPRAAKPEPAPPADGEMPDWAWPASGRLVGSFGDAVGTQKGIGISGKQGQPVLASAGGKVVYSGSGIRGYGKLVIIKHNNEFISVYAHNSELLVKDGQAVGKGQKIAEMGNSDSDQVKLHFEIRRYGKPVDPLKLLPDRPA